MPDFIKKHIKTIVLVLSILLLIVTCFCTYYTLKSKKSKVAKADTLTDTVLYTQNFKESFYCYRTSNTANNTYVSAPTLFNCKLYQSSATAIACDITFYTFVGSFGGTGSYNHSNTITLTYDDNSYVPRQVQLQFIRFAGNRVPDTMSTDFDFFTVYVPDIQGKSNPQVPALSSVRVEDISYYTITYFALESGAPWTGYSMILDFWDDTGNTLYTISLPVFSAYNIYDFNTRFYVDTTNNESSYSAGYNQGFNAGAIDKNQYGNERYQQGYYAGAESGSTLGDMILSVAEVPFGVINSMLDFNLLGVNVSTFVKSLLTMALVIWLIKFFI